MPCNDFAGDVLVSIVALHRQHDRTRDHCAKHRCRGQRLKRPASLTRTSYLDRMTNLARPIQLRRPIRIPRSLDAGVKTCGYVILRKRTKGAAQRQQPVILGLQSLIATQPPLELDRGSRIELAVAIGVHLQLVVISHRCNHNFTFDLLEERSEVACPGTDGTSLFRSERW